MNNKIEIYSSLKFVVENSQKLSSDIKFEKKLDFKKDRKNIGISFSGGKDTFLLLHKAYEEGFNVKFLFHLVDNSKNISITAPYNIEIIRKQAELLGIKLIEVDVSENYQKKF